MNPDDGSTDGRHINESEVLPYRSGSDEAPGRVRFYLTLCFGLLLSSAAVGGCGFAWVVNNLYLGPPPVPPHRRLNWELPLGATMMILMLLAGIALWAYRLRSRAMLLGMSIGFGVTVLMEGLCFTRL
jgi:nitrate reductase NapE component